MIELHIPKQSSDGSFESYSITPSPNHPIFIVGPNGSGKSALCHFLANQCLSKNQKNCFLRSSRRLTFNDKSINMTAATRKAQNSNSIQYLRGSDFRWKSYFILDTPSASLYDLIAASAQFNEDVVSDLKILGASSSYVKNHDNITGLSH